MSAGTGSQRTVEEILGDVEAAILAAGREVVQRPNADDAWDQLEEWAGKRNDPDGVGALYRSVMSAAAQADLGALVSRALRFHEEWYPEDADELLEVLSRALDVEEQADTAFQRMTVLFTSRERWADLLRVYDRRIASTEESTARLALLEEALQTARDFAKDDERTIHYLGRIAELDGGGGGDRTEALEKALERAGKWAELVDALVARAERAEPGARDAIELRVARIRAESLGDAQGAVAGASAVASRSPGHRAEALALVEAVASSGADASVRRAALRTLRQHAVDDAAALAVLDREIELLPEDQLASAWLEAGELAQRAGDAARAVRYLEQVFARDPANVDVRTRLRAACDRAGALDAYAARLEAAAETAEDAVAAQLRAEVASVRATALGDTAGAIAAYERLLEAASTDDERRGLIRTLVGLRRAEGNDAAALTLLEQEAGLTEDPSARVKILREVATLAGTVGERERAIAAYQGVVSVDPSDRGALDALVDLLGQAERHGDLVAVLGQRVRVADSPAEARRDRLAIAALQSGPLGDLEAAIVTLVGVAEAYGEDPDVVDGLSAAYEATGRYADLADLLQRADDREGAHLGVVRARLGDVRATHLGDHAGAVAAYERALDASPRNEDARAGLAVLCEEPSVAARAVESLAKSYASTDEWEPELALVPLRLANADRDEAKVSVLTRAATLAEERAGAPPRALAFLAEAFVLAPSNVRLESELERLAASHGLHAEAVAAFAAASASVAFDPARRAHLASRASALAAQSGDGAAALTHAVSALAARPHDGALADAVVALGADDAQLAVVEQALASACERADVDAEMLSRYASVLRRTGGEARIDVLVRLADRRGDDLDALGEALDVALASAPARALALAEALMARAARLLRTGGGTPARDAYVRAADLSIEALSAHDAAAAASVASEVARTLAAPERLAYARKAVELSGADVSDDTLVERIRDVLRDAEHDAAATDRLATVLDRAGRVAEVLQLRVVQLRGASSVEDRLAARLAIVGLVDRLDRETSRFDALQANLRESPGHAPSIDAIEALLMRERRPEELVDLLADQASRVAAPASLSMWQRVARLAEVELRDRQRARRAYEAIVEIEPSVSAYDALADIAEERGETAVAARWLERRLSLGAGPEADTSLRLGKALLALGRRDRALEVLEAAYQAEPARADLRDLLLATYRGANQAADVVRVCLRAVHHEPVTETRLALAKEAAHLAFHELDTPNDAIPMLELASELSPDERGLRVELAEAYRSAGRRENARDVLQKLVEEYGRRRTPERAQIHAELGRVLEELSDLPGAIAQLEQATQIAVTNAPMLLALGRLASRAGQTDRAEKTYRTLLVLVRRRSPEDAVDVSVGEVLFELAAIAHTRGEGDKAKELEDNALEAATASDAEVVRFVDALVARDAAKLALAGIEARLAARTGEPTIELARRHAAALSASGDAARALDVVLDTLTRFPGDLRARREARAAAARAGAPERFVAVAEAVSARLRRDEDAAALDSLTLLRAQALELDVGDAQAAAAIYEGLAETGGPEIARRARVGLARTLRVAGDVEAERAVQAKIRADESASADERIEALYRIAEIDLAVPERVPSAVEVLRQAVEEDGRALRAAKMLRGVAESGVLDADGFRAYEALARSSGDPAALLDYLLCRAERPDATMAEIREAVDRASAMGQADRARVLLLGLAEQAGNLTAEDARTVFLALAGLDEKGGDVASALRWLSRAADVSTADDARAIRVRIAQTASQPGGDARLALEAYRALLADTPDDASLHEGYVRLAAREADVESVQDAVERFENAGIAPETRTRLRVAVASFLDAAGGNTSGAIEMLRRALGDDPSATDAAQMLEHIFEREGYDGERARLLEQRLDVLLDAGPSAELSEVALRAAELHGRVDAPAAAAVLRRALERMPDDRSLIVALVDHPAAELDPRESAALREALIPTEPEDHVVGLSLQVYGAWEALEDEDGMMRALERALDRLGDDDVLRPRLEHLIRRRGDDARLVDLLVRRLRVATDPLDRKSLGLEAASILRTRLMDPARAAVVLEGLLVGPFDRQTFDEYVACLVDAGQREEAIGAVGRALEDVGGQEELRVALLTQRAALRREAGDLAFALADLEAIGEAHRDRTLEPMVELLGAIREDARTKGDVDRERSATLRLAGLLEAAHRAADVAAVLAAHVDVHGDDLEALEWLARMQASAGDDAGLCDTCERLVAVHTGEARVTTALTFADACERTGQNERGRALLERVRQDGDDPRIVNRLRAIYLAMGEHREVAAMLLAEARTATGDQKLECLLEAGRILLAIDPEAALEPLREAVAQKPDDLRLTVQFVDALLGAGQLAEAGGLLEAAIAAHPKRRTPELSMLQHRMGRYARATGDRDLEMQWLVASMECDKNNAESAADLAQVAMDLGDFETALNALRAITLARNEGPISRAMAYLLQAKIAHQRGESRRALLWARKAREVDATLAEVDAFLRELGENP